MISRKNSFISKKLSSTEESVDYFNVKLRRLKIDENILTKSVGKISDDLDDQTEDEDCYLVSKTLANKLKVSYIDIRDLFEELKDNTSTEDNLQSLDIEDVKKDVMNIEAKIKEFKIFLQTKLKNLQSDEQELIEQITEVPDELLVTKKQKVQVKPFIDILPSPVKVLIKSPFKCQEVQEFQEFLSNSKNKYGGWIQYNHNIFENCWHKYFNMETNIEIIQNSRNFHDFTQDICKKIPDLTFEEIQLHIDWYSKYLHLKERQQKALQKWKRKKELLKKPLQKKSCIDTIQLQSKDENNSNEKNKKKSTILPCFTDSKSFSQDYVNELVSDELQKINDQLSEEITRCISTEGDTEFEHLINETIDCKTSGSVSTLYEIQMEYFLDKVAKTTFRPHLSYRNATEQWNSRCNGTKDFCPNYMDITSLTKRRVPDWRLGLHSDQ